MYACISATHSIHKATDSASTKMMHSLISLERMIVATLLIILGSIYLCPACQSCEALRYIIDAGCNYTRVTAPNTCYMHLQPAGGSTHLYVIYKLLRASNLKPFGVKRLQLCLVEACLINGDAGTRYGRGDTSSLSHHATQLTAPASLTMQHKKLCLLFQ